MKKKGFLDNLNKVERQVFWLFVILMIIFIATIGTYQIFKPKPYFEYGEFKVYKIKVQGVQIDYYAIPISVMGGKVVNLMLRNDPRTLNINNSVDSSFLRGFDKLWVTMNPNLTADATISASEILNFASILGYESEYAFTEGDGNYKKMTCKDAPDGDRVIEIKLSNETKVYSESRCIIISAKDYDDMIKASESLILEWMKSMIIK